MTSRVDLHVHTTASDGQLSPTEVVNKALMLGLAAIAITDHDTVEGVTEALEAAKGTALDVIPGVEISCDVPRSEVHILGYYVAFNDLPFRNMLAFFRNSRLQRAQRIVAKLSRMGLTLDWNRVQQIAGEAAVGRPHIARAMLEKGYVSSIDEAFNLYIGRNSPAYEKRAKLSPSEAVHSILAANGLPVLAHPLNVSHLVPELAKDGLVGLEAYYPGYTREEIQFLLNLAAKYELLVTGGSDFHGEDMPPWNKLGGVMVPQAIIEKLRNYHERMQAKA